MMGDDQRFAGRNDWFEYAYYSSTATLGSADDAAITRAKPLRLQ